MVTNYSIRYVCVCVSENMKIDLCDFPSYTYIPNKGIK